MSRVLYTCMYVRMYVCKRGLGEYSIVYVYVCTYLCMYVCVQGRLW